jgi:hypothetical protein
MRGMSRLADELLVARKESAVCRWSDDGFRDVIRKATANVRQE